MRPPCYANSSKIRSYLSVIQWAECIYMGLVHLHSQSSFRADHSQSLTKLHIHLCCTVHVTFISQHYASFPWNWWVKRSDAVVQHQYTWIHCTGLIHFYQGHQQGIHHNNENVSCHSFHFNKIRFEQTGSSLKVTSTADSHHAK